MSPTRRAVLAGGLLLPVAACTGREPAPVRPVPVDPDVALRAAAVARERGLLAAYDVALRQDPARAERLAPLRAEHAAHLAALGEQEAPSTGSPSPALPTTPAASTPARGDLATAERAAAAAHAAATAAASPALAAVLAQLAASEASHPVALA